MSYYSFYCKQINSKYDSRMTLILQSLLQSEIIIFREYYCIFLVLAYDFEFIKT